MFGVLISFGADTMDDLDTLYYELQKNKDLRAELISTGRLSTWFRGTATASSKTAKEGERLCIDEKYLVGCWVLGDQWTTTEQKRKNVKTAGKFTREKACRLIYEALNLPTECMEELKNLTGAVLTPGPKRIQEPETENKKKKRKEKIPSESRSRSEKSDRGRSRGRRKLAMDIEKENIEEEKQKPQRKRRVLTPWNVMWQQEHDEEW